MLLPPANEVLGKVIFSEACVKNSVHWGAMRARGACVTGGHAYPRGACMQEGHACLGDGSVHTWQGACVVEGYAW